LVYESYVPVKEFREKRSLVRHRIALSRTKTKLANKIHSILDKYEYRTELADIFGKSGIQWLKSLPLSPIDKIILNTTLSSIETIDSQIEIVSKEIAKYAWKERQSRYKDTSQYNRYRHIFCHANINRDSRYQKICNTMETC
jgi:transposase